MHDTTWKDLMIYTILVKVRMLHRSVPGWSKYHRVGVIVFWWSYKSYYFINNHIRYEIKWEHDSNHICEWHMSDWE